MVVILIICIISVLVIYMTFLSCLDPILNKRRAASATYQEQTNDEVRGVDTPGYRRDVALRSCCGGALLSLLVVIGA